MKKLPAASCQLPLPHTAHAWRRIRPVAAKIKVKISKNQLKKCQFGAFFSIFRTKKQLTVPFQHFL
jgi:hypothetical protein